MNRGTYRKLWAILGASVLTLGVVSVAMALELKEEHRGVVIGWDENGDPFVDGFDKVNAEECVGEDLAPGEILIHFVQTQAVPNPAGQNLLDVEFDGAPDQTGVVEDGIQGSNVDWFVGTTSDGGDITIVTANSNIDGGQLVISHICVGDQPEEETAPPTEAPTDTPVPTATPFQSVFEETDAPTETPFQSVEGDTDEPSEPDTATIGGSKDLGSPANGAWLLVVALGVLLASIVVLTPARAKAPRR
jgi:hypothetical protein